MKLSSKIGVALLAGSILLSGCGSNSQIEQLQKENSDLKVQVNDLQKQNKELENKVAMYVPNDSSQKAEDQSQSDQPVKLVNIEFDKSGVTSVKLSFQNLTPKTIDAIEFVILQFDNFGRPAYRFNDPSYGNISSPLTMQGNASPKETLNGAWTLFNTEKTTKGKIIIKQVHFTDGSTWTNDNFQSEVNDKKGSYE